MFKKPDHKKTVGGSCDLVAEDGKVRGLEIRMLAIAAIGCVLVGGTIFPEKTAGGFPKESMECQATMDSGTGCPGFQDGAAR